MAFATIAETVEDGRGETTGASRVVDSASTPNQDDLISIIAYSSDGGAISVSGFSEATAFTESSHAPYGVAIATTPDTSGGETVLWKPNA